MEQKELWKSISGYDNVYEVSNYGRVRSLDRITNYKAYGKTINRKRKGKIITPQRDGRNAYLQVKLVNGEKKTQALVHRLVAEAFIENPCKYPEVNHKDENKKNNRAENLEWCDHTYNNNYGTKKNKTRGENNPMAKLTRYEVKRIRDEFIPYDHEYGLTGLSKKYKISIVHVRQIVMRERWGWLD